MLKKRRLVTHEQCSLPLHPHTHILMSVAQEAVVSRLLTRDVAREGCDAEKRGACQNTGKTPLDSASIVLLFKLYQAQSIHKIPHVGGRDSGGRLVIQ